MAHIYNKNAIKDIIKNYNNDDNIEFYCSVCGNIFTKKRKFFVKKGNLLYNNLICSNQCKINNLNTQILTNCGWCNQEIKRVKNQYNRSKSGNIFCSKSCAAKYNNTHKTTGNRRSKLEVYLEEKLCKEYNFTILFNDKTIINSELDIYIPQLKLAFELNGIFHYEPIYGQDKLNSIKNNDSRKFQACLENGIELCIIDSSKLKYFKIEKANGYFEIIKKIIDKKWRPMLDSN